MILFKGPRTLENLSYMCTGSMYKNVHSETKEIVQWVRYLPSHNHVVWMPRISYCPQALPGMVPECKAPEHCQMWPQHKQICSEQLVSIARGFH